MSWADRMLATVGLQRANGVAAPPATPPRPRETNLSDESPDQKFVDEVISQEAGRTGSSQPPANLEEYLAAATCHPWMYSGVSKIAENLAAVPMIAEQRTADGWEHRPDSDVQALLDHPWPMFTGPDFVEETAWFWIPTGSVGIYLDRGDDPLQPAQRREIKGMRALRPTRMEIKPGEGWVKEFRYRIGGNVTRIHPDNLLWLRLVDPTRDYWGLSPFKAAARAINLDEKIEVYNDRTVTKGGRPDMALETDKPLNESKARRVRRRWMAQHGSYDKTGGVMVLDSGLKAKEMGLSPKDMQFEKQHTVAKRRQLSTIGVPPVLVMDMEDASVLANVRDQRRIFFENTILPHGNKLAARITMGVQSWKGEEWRVRFDWDKVEVLQEDDDRIWTRATSAYQNQVITRNEARQEMGLEPMEGGDELFVPASPSPLALSVGDDRKEEKVPRIQESDTFKQLARSSFRSLARSWEPRLEDAFGKALDEQRKRVVRRFRELRSQGFKASESVATSDILREMFDTVAEADAFRSQVGPVFLAGLLDAADGRIEQLLPRSTIEALRRSTERFEAFVETWSGSRVVRIQEATQRDLARLMQQGFEEGWTDHRLQQEMGKLWKQYGEGPAGAEAVETRLERIARTETATMLNRGSFEGVRDITEAGGVVVKSWLSARDGLVRLSHQLLDEQTSASPIPFDQQFETFEGKRLLHPNDPSGDPGETINCRCSTVEEVKVMPTGI